ncbi:MAG TPA: hypothetical protein VMF87_08000 [Streptosporangiaceae bacterium]|nr:hypothetical protein [Streptosporangiaceae bacterium]
MSGLRGLLAALPYEDARRLTGFMAKCRDDNDDESGLDDGPSAASRDAYGLALKLAASGASPAAPFTIAAMAWERFPDGPAADAYLGGAGLADYRRCETPACPRGVPTPRSRFCGQCAKVRQRAQQRAYKHRQHEPVPSCCTTRRCPQHRDNAVAWRGYRHAWSAGSRGMHRIEWLFGIFGGSAADAGWSVTEGAAGTIPENDEAARWLRTHGEKVPPEVEGAW